MLQSIMQKEKAGSRFLEFATVHESGFTRTQIERRGDLVFMRAKKRAYAFS